MKTTENPSLEFLQSIKLNQKPQCKLIAILLVSLAAEIVKPSELQIRNKGSNQMGGKRPTSKWMKTRRIEKSIMKI